MSAPATLDGLLDVVRKSGLVAETALTDHLSTKPLPDDPAQAVETLIQAGLLTRFHAHHLLQGKFKGFVLDSYKVLRPLAKGGMSLVYLAEHVSLHRRVALKIFPTELMWNTIALERFYREGRAAAALNHPNIVRVYDFGRAEDLHFLVMEYVEGNNLEEVVRARGRLPYRQAVNYILQAAQGLAHAHERGLIHRDIKPANLLLDKTGTIKILDMGLARFFEDATDNLTERAGNETVLGTPDYISPEQALHQLDIRSDIYSLGATLHALLLGEPPFAGKSAAEKLMAHQLRQVVPPHRRDVTIPEELSAVVVRMLAKKPEDRYQTPNEVIEALTPWAPKAQPSAELPVAPSQTLTPEAREKKGQGRVPYWVVIVGSIVAALVCGATLFLTLWR
jgi:serine/threonine protein kinase